LSRNGSLAEKTVIEQGELACSAMSPTLGLSPHPRLPRRSLSICGQLAAVPGVGYYITYMAHKYSRCKDCGISRELVSLSKRGRCAKCATLRSLQQVAGAVAISAAVQVRLPDQPPEAGSPELPVVT
jgi:hypothetical protein